MFSFNGKKTVDTVLEAFRSAITDLESVAAAEKAEAQRQAEVIVLAQAAKDAAEAEATRATSIAAKMQAVFQ